MPATFYVGDAIEVMGKLPEHSVDLVLSSPPFWKLRSYLPADHESKAVEGGSEDTPGEFIDWLIDVAEACDRVLAPHGSMAFELGDTYSNGDGGGPRAKSLTLIPEMFRFSLVYGFNPLTGRKTEPWILRNVIRWVRPNPPVGALGDKFRPATSELMVFCKSAKRYFDLDAVREPAVSIPQRFFKHAYGMRTGGDDFGETVEGRPPLLEPGVRVHPAGAPPLDWWNIPLLEGEEETRYGPGEKPRVTPRDGDPKQMAARQAGVVRGAMAERTYHQDGGAPPLDWWEIPPGGYEGAHYAVFPPELCVKPVKAMCPEKVCRQCGEPSRRIVGEAEYINSNTGKPVTTLHHREGVHIEGQGNSVNSAGLGDRAATRVAPTLGFSDCGHDDWRPGMVLDPFVGSGTTLMVATGHGRDAIGIDLDSRNFDLALERVGPFILTRGEDD